MKLFKFENFQLTFTEEALLIKAFRDLWERDTTKSKLQAQLELGFIYFYCDPRSDYMFLVDKESRMDKIKEQEGLPTKWKPDNLIIKAIETYEYLTTTTSSLLLQDTRILIENLRSKLRTMNLDEVDERGKPIYTLNTVTSTIKLIPELSDTISKAEQSLTKEIDEVTKMRGGGAQKILENGYNFTKNDSN